MLETFIALTLAHLLGDFVFQPRWMVERKARFPVLAVHVAAILLLTVATTGTVDPGALLAIGITHLVIDIVKASLGRSFRVFILDQAAHFAVIGAVALWLPGLFASGWWADPPWPGAAERLAPLLDHYIPAATVISGLIAALIAGRYGIELFMAPLSPNRHSTDGDEGLTDGGLNIGVLERALVFLFVMLGEFAAIGFLIAAKSILRFGVSSKDRAMSEYVIIGTLMSFGWAIAVAALTRAALLAVTATP